MYGDKDPDGFYWGELRGRRGYVPHNMVTEIEENQVVGGGSGPQNTVGALGGTNSTTPNQPVQPSVRGVSRDRWGDIYANMPVKRMVALYDYDPQELSPNVDAEVSPLISLFTVYPITHRHIGHIEAVRSSLETDNTD